MNAEHDLINILEDKFLLSKIIQDKEFRIRETLTKISLVSNEGLCFILDSNGCVSESDVSFINFDNGKIII